MSQKSEDTVKKGVDLDELQDEVSKLLKLLEDRHPGHMSWQLLMHERMVNLKGLILQAVPSNAYLVRTHGHSYRLGQPAVILGVECIPIDGGTHAAGYRIRFEDGVEDLIPLSENHHFEIISEKDVKAGKLPETVCRVCRAGSLGHSKPY